MARAGIMARHSVNLLVLWPVAIASLAGDGSTPDALCRFWATVAIVALLLGWLPALVLLFRARRGGWLMIAAGRGPFVTLGYTAIAAPIALR